MHIFYSQSQTMLRRLKSLLIPTKLDWAQGFTLAPEKYVDHTGVEHRTFEGTSLPYLRLQAAAATWERYQFKTTTPMVLQWAVETKAMAKQIASLNAGNIQTIQNINAQVYALASEMQVRCETLAADHEACLYIAAYLYVQKDENQAQPDHKLIAQKVARWLQSEEDMAFFIGAALPLMQQFCSDYSLNTPAYYAEQVQALRRFRVASALGKR